MNKLSFIVSVAFGLALMASPNVSFSQTPIPTPNGPATPPVVTPSTSALPVIAPVAQNVEGTIEVTGNGRTQRATVHFSAPDSLAVRIEPNDANFVAGQTYVARGANQWAYNEWTKRVRRWGWSSAQQPWRSQALADAGPANILLWGWNPEIVGKYYSVATTTNGVITTVKLTAKTALRRWVLDELRSGGRGDKVFYAAYKRPIFDWPARVALELDASKHPLSMERRDDRNRIIDRTTFTWTGDFPTAAVTTDANGAVIGRWTYALKKAAEAAPETTFDLKSVDPAVAQQVVEEPELDTIARYKQRIQNSTGAAKASTYFNLGLAHLRHTQDIPAAATALKAAVALQPRAIAPLAQLFDVGYQARNLQLAEGALNSLTSLLGEEDATVAQLTARLALLRRDYAGAEAAYKQAAAARPADLATRYSLANLKRLQGRWKEAQADLEAILASTSPLYGAQANAARALATLYSAPSLRDEAKAVAAALPQETEAQKLARALLLLQSGAKDTTLALNNDALMQEWAEAQSAFGASNGAFSSWATVVKRGDIGSSTQARRNLMTLYAQRGDVANSLVMLQAVLIRDVDEEARNNTRQAFFTAWRKAMRGDTLKRALEQRAVSNSAAESDVRLWLEWQETYASAQKVGATLRQFAAKYPRSAWWQSRLAEQLVGEAEALKKDSTGTADRLRADAMAAVNKAIALDPAQPYYPMQRALILARRANELRTAAVVDPGASSAAVKAAQEAIEELRTKRSNDPDVLIAAAVAQQALAARDTTSLTDLQRGLEIGSPGRETASGDRFVAAFVARQALTIALRRRQQWQPAADEYERLMMSAGSAGDEAAIAGNYMVLLNSALQQGVNLDILPDSGSETTMSTSVALARGATALLERLCSEPWPFEDVDTATRAFVMRIQSDQNLWPAVVNVLRRRNGDSSKLAYAYLLSSIENGLRTMIAAPGVDSGSKQTATDTLKQVEPWSKNAEERLKDVVAGGNPVLQSRVQSLLAERAFARGDYAEAIEHLQKSVAAELNNEQARLALARAYVAAGEKENAQKVRDELLRVAPHSAALLRQVAAILQAVGDTNGAHHELEQAWSVALFDEGTGTRDVQTIGFLLARARLAGGDTQGAKAIYTGLASSQWSRASRGAALLDWAKGLRSRDAAGANAVKQQLDALQLQPSELKQAQAIADAMK